MANKSDNIIREEARAIEVGEETGGTPQQRRQRDSWASRTGFILACVGSAVGMANIWLFPYRVAQLGGAAFLIPYLIFVALLGFTGVIGEMSFGRAMGTGPMGAFGKAMEMRGIRKGGLIGKIVGLVPTLGSLALAIGYAVVLGWACHYLFSSLTGELMAQSDMGAFFGGIASDFGNVGFHVAGLVITFVIMILGVSRGIERVNKVLMPLLFILFIVIAIRVAMLSGASEGYLYLLVPRWEALLNPTTWVYALGQAFFSLSLAGCGTLVYGSYLKKDVDVVSCCAQRRHFRHDCESRGRMRCRPRRICLRARCLLRLRRCSSSRLRQVFQQMPFGDIFAVILFVAVVFAAITSLMNLFEAPVEALQEQLGLSRTVSVLIIAVIAVGVGLFIEGGSTVSDWMDVISIYVIPVGAFLAAIMFFWVCPRGFAKRQAELGRKRPLGRWFDFFTRYVFVFVTALVIILGIFYGGIG